MVTINPYLGVTKEDGYNKRRSRAYQNKYIRRYSFHVNKRTEKKIIAWLDNNKPYQHAIKELILEQIKRERKKGV